ncbi:hypothetical protein N0V84_010709 [Fusarium piperis]|uniref:Uncharacterized protein n=1 Tax=Fusarium piperis TaxID=1435070 RepID=A0A9W8TET1_9HYPO|nr:hypothetical protein N0V84_010709 [Fusarium piperis]
MSSSEIANWLSRVGMGRNTSSRTQQRGVEHNYCLRSTYSPSEDEGPATSIPSRETNSSPGLILTPSSSSRPSTNNSQATFEEQQRQRLGRLIENQMQKTRELSQSPELTIHEEILRRQEAERALQVIHNDLKAFHESIGSIVDHTELVTILLKKAEKEPTKENMDGAMSEVLSVGERLAELHASIWDTLLDEK